MKIYDGSKINKLITDKICQAEFQGEKYAGNRKNRNIGKFAQRFA